MPLGVWECGVTANDLDDALALVKAELFPGRDLPDLKRVTTGVSGGRGKWAGGPPPKASPERGVWYPPVRRVTQPYPAVFAADLTLLPTREGGRRTAIGSGYRSIIRLMGTSQDFGMELRCDHNIEPGATGQVEVTVWAGDLFPTVKAGDAFEIREGPTVVGRGVTGPYSK
jgi:hypothetical protein